ncbi:unnamed protein product [Schistosoma mattheei]|uniref:SH3 domain-containing protein n=1 Tax=Schistosoma mattheei TaxID=31246 RepID=A0AA85B2E7_9TREM|nr:unnamed protein product [Schistosoma mattheei]
MTVTPNDASMPMFELSLRSIVERRPIFPSKISFNNGQSSNFMLPAAIVPDSSQSFDQIRYQPIILIIFPTQFSKSRERSGQVILWGVPATVGDKPSVGNSSCLPNTHHPTNFSPIQQPANFLNNSISKEGQFVALHDYVKRVDDDLNMTKGQIFNMLDNSDCDWWYAGCVSTDSRGYVPKNHLAAVTSLESNEWYFGGLKRIEAEHYLQLPGNDHGSFLVRISESQSSEYSLSVREENTVKHDRIRPRYSRTDLTLKRLYISRQVPYVNI